MGSADGGRISRQRSKDIFIPWLRTHTNVSDALQILCGELNRVLRVPFGVKRLSAACGVMITGACGAYIRD